MLKINRYRHFNKQIALCAVFICIFAAAGTYLVISSHAATPLVAVEAENGNIGGSASTYPDPNASGGRAVQFNSPVITNPTHLMDDQWNFSGTSQNYTLIDTSVDITPKVNGPPIGSPDGYFYAAEFYFNGNKTGYMGLQDEGNDGAGTILTKSALVQIYGATSGTAASGTTEACGNPSGEGQSCYIHLAYTWQTGHTYRFDLSLQKLNDGNGNEIWNAQFTDVTTGSVVQLGTLNTPISFGGLGNAVITFHERFSGPTDQCGDQMPSSVVFSRVMTNNASPVASASTPQSYNSPCPGFVSNTLSGNTVTSSYGLAN